MTVKKTTETPGSSGLDERGTFSRRQFISSLGGVGVGAILGGLVVKSLFLPDKVFAIAASGGYLLVDTKKCAGCQSCMLACSLTHHGETNQSLSRIQILQDPWGKFPEDITIAQCRQCPYPACVQACPFGARQIGNIKDPNDPVTKIIMTERVGILKEEYGTKPQVFYIGLDREVK